MTEAEWFSDETHPQLMWRQLSTLRAPRTKVGRRKLRLLACGGCRLIWSHLTEPGLTTAVEVAERFADGHATPTELASAGRAIDGLRTYRADQTTPPQLVSLAYATTEEKPHSAALWATAYQEPFARLLGSAAVEQGLVRGLFRDVFGNPFAPVASDASWRTEAVVGLARGMYEGRDFGPMAVLADALEDAGCGAADVLAHCRGGGPHVRGCWVADLVLGKA